MPELIFEGDWSDDEIGQIAPLLKSFGMGDSAGIPDTLTLPTIAPGLLSKRQKELIELWRNAGTAAMEFNEDEEPDRLLDWSEYDLHKTVVGARKTNPKTGTQYQFTAKHRWQKTGGTSKTSVPSELINFRFPIAPGKFGEGVYLPAGEQLGNLLIRVRINIKESELISPDKFDDLEEDMNVDMSLVLDAQEIKGIVSGDGLMVRSPSDIEIMGILNGSGSIPSGVPKFVLVDLVNRDDYLLADIAFGEESAPLEKSISDGSIQGTRLLPASPSLNRELVREAIAHCKEASIPVDQIKVRILPGIPDFLPHTTHAFCLPIDGIIHLCPHDPDSAIADFLRQLGDRLWHGLNQNAISSEDAFSVLQSATQLTASDWLQMLLTRFTGAILIERSQSLWGDYLKLLSGRGVEYWGDRGAIAECMAEDYRCALSPGIPNLITLEWDLASPAIARLAQQTLLNTLNANS